MVLWQPGAAGMDVSSPNETREQQQGGPDRAVPAWVGLEPQTLGCSRLRQTHMRRLPGADIDRSSLLLGHSKGLLKERFLSMALTKI